MRILGLDTATRATTVALLDTDDGRWTERRDDPPAGARPRHTTRLMALIAEAMEATSSTWEDIGLLAVGVGPGTFTGLRIGVASARALAGARGIALVGVSTLASLAHRASGGAAPPHDAILAHGVFADAAPPHDAILAVLDARRSEVFAAGFAAGAGRGGDGADGPLLAPCAIAPAALAQTIERSGRTWLAIGEGAVEFRAVLEGSGAWIPEVCSPMHRVSAVEHCRLAKALPPASPDDVRPHYLRLPDAELALGAARQR
jgi:tRNA threonylcarbamoyladenosine biosynthesis protein TsaB